MKKDLTSKPDIDNMDTNELIKALKHQDSNIRARAAGALEYDGNEKAIEPLIEALRDKSDFVRRNAVWTLGFLVGEMGVEGVEDTRILKFIINTLNDKSPDVRESAVLALKYLRDEENLKPLIQALGDEDIIVRCAAVESLEEYGIMGYQGIIKSLTETLLNDENSDVRSEAARALDCSENEEIEGAIEPLIRALSDKESNVRFAAARSLGVLGHDLEDKRVVVPLIEVLKDEDRDVRLSAIWALGLIRNEKGEEPLSQILKCKDEDIVDAAIGALLKILQAKNKKELIQEVSYNFQCIEEVIKDYINCCYQIILKRINSLILFNFSYNDVSCLPLGRLIKKFEKFNSNKSLINELKKMKPHRDLIVHRGRLDKNISKKYLEDIATKSSKILGKLNKELTHVEKIRSKLK